MSDQADTTNPSARSGSSVSDPPVTSPAPASKPAAAASASSNSPHTVSRADTAAAATSFKSSSASSLLRSHFKEAPSDFALAFGASLPVDRRMWESDIEASIAHVRMLAKQGIISSADGKTIEEGLKHIAISLKEGSFVFDTGDEDIHMAIERRLIQDIGKPGKRLHTARSRNDQVATDMRLHSKKLCVSLMHQLLDIRGTFLDVAQREFGVVMPGYTHMQPAQPVLFSHHMLAYYWMFVRDFDRMRAAERAADVLPLGSAALAGSPYPLDRAYVAEQLGFSRISPNSMDAVSDRDFALDLIYACSVACMHLSRLCEEIVYWSSNEFGFITLSDAYATGSSIMPQKKNPDFAELVRGKTARVYGDLMTLLCVMKALPLCYNKDMQEDKEALFDAVDTLSSGLKVVSGMLETMSVNAPVMRAAAHGGYMAATDLADYLVNKGLPFRDAYAIVGKLVLACERDGKTLQELSKEELSSFDARFGADASDAVDIDKVVARRDSVGGTGTNAVRAQFKDAEKRLKQDTEFLENL